MTTWHGVTLDARSAEMMNEVARLCDGIVIDPTQGSWSGADASAGTHSGAGAIDIAAANLPQSHRDKIVYEMRRVGWAAWLRTPAQSDWPYHIHGIACAEPGLSGPARDQEQDYYAGRNGLASNAPDDGPRDFVGVTWEDYSAGSSGGWLIEGVVSMASRTIVFFSDGQHIWEADLLANTRRAMPSEKTLADRRHILEQAGVPYLNWDGVVENPDAFGEVA